MSQNTDTWADIEDRLQDALKLIERARHAAEKRPSFKLKPHAYTRYLKALNQAEELVLIAAEINDTVG